MTVLKIAVFDSHAVVWHPLSTERGDWKCGSGKCDTGKNARVENAGVENARCR